MSEPNSTSVDASQQPLPDEYDVRPPVMLNIAKRAHLRMRNLCPNGQIHLLSTVAKPWDNQTLIQLYAGGKKHTRNPEWLGGSWRDFGNFVADAAQAVFPKGEGPWISTGISDNGGCCDRDVSRITQLFFDCDGAGDWNTGLDALERASVSYVASRSVSHSAQNPKFHLHVPLWRPFVGGNKGEWRQHLLHLTMVMGTLFQLRIDLEATPAKFGFDHATSRLAQPIFLATRRREQDVAPQVITYEGGALDAETLLHLTGYERVLKSEARFARAHRKKVAKAPSSVPQGGPSIANPHLEGRSLIERAFSAAGMLGPVLPNGARAVLCPWRYAHTSGNDWDTSTVLFPPNSRGRGAFHCSHSHCTERKAVDALRVLPTEAVAIAMNGGVR